MKKLPGFLLAFLATLLSGSIISNVLFAKNNIVENTGNISAEFRSQLSDAMEIYLVLEKAIFDEKQQKAGDEAIALQKAMAAIDPGSLPEKMALDWQKHIENLEKASNMLASERDIKKQRKSFLDISNVLIAIVKDFGPLDYTVYLFHCPMAADSGGHWLSNSGTVANPFLGEKMANCGTFIEKFVGKE